MHSIELRAFATFSHTDKDAEIAVVVDVIRTGSESRISADVSTDDGIILQDGPSTVIPNSETEAALEKWLHSFERWLVEIAPVVAQDVAKLS